MSRRQWLAYGDGSYEAVDPAGNLNRKKRGPGREDWWVMEQDADWEPPFGMKRPMNKKSIYSGGSGDWERPGGLAVTLPAHPIHASPSGLGTRDGQDPAFGTSPKEKKMPYKPNPDAKGGPFLTLLKDDSGPANRITSAHGAARTGKDGRTEARLLDRGLDPAIEVKTRREGGSQSGGQSTGAVKNRGLLAPTSTQVQGSDLSGKRWNGPKIGPKPEPKPEPKIEPETGLWSSLLGKGFQDEPQERNPNQTAREMEELAKRPESSAKQARDMEGVDKSVRKVPRQAPDGVLGSPEYYRWRAEEFKQRHPDKEPPDYLLNYGDKYAKIFRDEIRPNLTDEGKKWVDRTMRGLQERMEKAYQDGTLDEMDPKAFKDFAFDSHLTEYTDKEFGALDYGEQVYILDRLRQEKDFFTPQSIGVMLRMGPHMLDHAKKKRGKVGDALMNWLDDGDVPMWETKIP